VSAAIRLAIAPDRKVVSRAAVVSARPATWLIGERGKLVTATVVARFLLASARASTVSLVLPVWGQQPSALVLSVHGDQLTRVGTIQHPVADTAMQRSLVIGGTLWTLSDQGLQANDLVSLAQQAWVPLV